ncbi:PREDICTED: uncharacterized protein LOC106890517 [Calidris pugnax]|uniref:uncharacterized protein LOC106890517 n=1 Tax=Calidris pugnax TaxID=198806 RepID=UPI00071D6995|nr:PREDICTED: uncharacterized protein LOC106890517 [Calidris pugnax]
MAPARPTSAAARSKHGGFPSVSIAPAPWRKRLRPFEFQRSRQSRAQRSRGSHRRRDARAGAAMDSLPGDDLTLPVAFEGSISQPPDVSRGDPQPGPAGSEVLPDVTEDTVSPTRARTMKDYENQITDLKKENFNLKLRIYFLEERMQQKFDGPTEEIYKINIELKVEIESLKRNLQEREKLLIKASWRPTACSPFAQLAVAMSPAPLCPQPTWRLPAQRRPPPAANMAASLQFLLRPPRTLLPFGFSGFTSVDAKMAEAIAAV